jgi:aminoglycoside/choline kinase family phosphotransferase
MKEDAIKLATEILSLYDIQTFDDDVFQSAINILKKYKINIQKHLNLDDEDYDKLKQKFKI